MGYYTVPTNDKSISSVRGAVLAAGVSLLFLYLVTSRLTSGELCFSNPGYLRIGPRGKGEE